MTFKTRRRLGWITLVVSVAAIWWFILPPNLGGRTTLLTTSGISMQPSIHTGDLAVLRKKSHYQVGDIVAYHSVTLDAITMHRIVAIDQNGITTKGDNNSWTDIDRPTDKQIVGKMDHLYKHAGREVAWMRLWPVRLFGALLIAWAVFNGFARREGGQPSARARVADLRVHAQGLRTFGSLDSKLPFGKLPYVLGGIFVCASLVSLVAFTRPVTTPDDKMLMYSLHGDFGYSGQASGGDLVYQDGQLSTGDPVYLKLVQQLFVTFNYRMDSPSRFKGSGRIEMNAVLKGKSGWTHPLPLSTPTTLSGEQGRISVIIDLQQVRDLAQQVQRMTSVNDNGFILSLKPTVRVDGTLAGQALKTDFSPELALTGDALQLKVADAPPVNTRGPKDNNDTMQGLHTTKGGTLPLPGGMPVQLQTLGRTMAVGTLRLAGALGMVLSGLALGAYIVTARRPRREDEDGHTAGPFDGIVVPIKGWGASAASTSVVDLPSMAELARVAEAHDALILHDSSNGDDVFLVNHSHLTYRYARHAPSAESRFGTAVMSDPTAQHVKS